MQYIFDGKRGGGSKPLFFKGGGDVSPPQIYCGDAHVLYVQYVCMKGKPTPPECSVLLSLSQPALTVSVAGRLQRLRSASLGAARHCKADSRSLCLTDLPWAPIIDVASGRASVDLYPRHASGSLPPRTPPVRGDITFRRNTAGLGVPSSLHIQL